MNIGRQWSDRLRLWAEQFPKHYFRKAENLPLSYFTTFEHLPFAQAVQGSFVPAPIGMKWGKKWEYAWFHTTITIPSRLQGQRAVFTLGCGEEMLVWVNGQEAGAIDKHHKFITLSCCANAGDIYEIYAECYAGHGLRNEGAGPVAWGDDPVPEPPQAQQTIAPSLLGLWNEPLFQAAMDYLTLYSLVQKLPEKSLRTMKIVEGLKKFTYIADFELPEPEMTASVVEAAKVLQPLLQCKNGSTAPEYTIFGQSHLDLAWLWPVEETMRKSARTYSNQLALMEQYPDYKFLLCEPPIPEYLKTLYPQVYARVKEKLTQGAFMAEGAMWVESDTNIPSGESLIRQFSRGKRWYRKELGVDSQMAWMPDTFGFSAALPQIMKKCHIPYFATQKLVRQDPECEPFPYNVFWWEGMDGSKVLSHLFKKNNAVFLPGDLITRWEEDRIQQENIDGLMYPFGYGDGGGGPTREMIEMARRCADLEGAPRCRMESPVRYFERQKHVENIYRGELYLAWHRGTLTAQAKTKQYIRQAEIALKKAEYGLALRKLSGKSLPKNWEEQLDELWKKLLFNQFHDIAPGSSIARVHETAEEQLKEVVSGCETLLNAMGMSLEGGSVAYNHLSWERTFKNVKMPAQGCVAVSGHVPSHAATVTETGDGWVLENGHLRCCIDKQGRLTGICSQGKEFLSAPGNELLLFKDVNTCYDAWELGSMYENLPVQLDDSRNIQALSDPDGAALLVTGQVGNSPFSQKIILENDAKRLDFVTTVQWQERHKLLKVSFPVNAYANEAIHEIQFGFVKRPTHRSRQHDKDQYEVCNHRYTALTDGAVGAAVLNDGKYGINVAGSELRLTLLRAPMMPDSHADQGIQEFTYSFCPFIGSFADSEVLRQAVELNETPLFGSDLVYSQPIFLPGAKNIIAETVKIADETPNALLVRVYEAMGQQTDCSFTLHSSIRSVWETDMLEENPKEVDVQAVHFDPFEIKTFILQL